MAIHYKIEYAIFQEGKRDEFKSEKVLTKNSSLLREALGLWPGPSLIILASSCIHRNDANNNIQTQFSVIVADTKLQSYLRPLSWTSKHWELNCSDIVYGKTFMTFSAGTARSNVPRKSGILSGIGGLAWKAYTFCLLTSPPHFAGRPFITRRVGGKMASRCVLLNPSVPKAHNSECQNVRIKLN